MHRLEGRSAGALLLSVALLAGCSSRSGSAPPVSAPPVGDACAADVVVAARTVLGRMGFALQKADARAGIVRTEPLPGAQFFEFWRSDNATLSDALQANLHSIRRSVEIRFTPGEDRWRIDCTVRVERLSLPGEEVASVSQAYRIHSRSDPDFQTFLLTPHQRALMTWVDLGHDERLAAVILKRIEEQIARQRTEEAS